MIFFMTLEFLMLWIAIPDKTMTTVIIPIPTSKALDIQNVTCVPHRVRL